MVAGSGQPLLTSASALPLPLPRPAGIDVRRVISVAPWTGAWTRREEENGDQREMSHRVFTMPESRSNPRLQIGDLVVTGRSRDDAAPRQRPHPRDAECTDGGRDYEGYRSSGRPRASRRRTRSSRGRRARSHSRGRRGRGCACRAAGATRRRPSRGSPRWRCRCPTSTIATTSHAIEPLAIASIVFVTTPSA